MNLRLLRETLGISQTELGKKIGVARSTICQYESGRREPDNETLQRLADFFNVSVGVSVDYLLGREQPVEKQEISVPEKYKDVMVAFQDGAENLTQEDIDDVVKFIEFLKNKKK